MFHVDVVFIDKASTAANDEGFALHLSLKMKYDEFAKLVGEHLAYDPKKIQFFRSNSMGGSGSYELKSAASLPLAPIKYNPDFALNDAFKLGNLSQPLQAQQQQNQQQQPARKLYYQKLKLTLLELEERRQFKCLWVSSNMKVEREVSFMPLKKANVREMLAECRDELLREGLITREEHEDERGFRLRLVEIVGYKISRVFKEEVLFETLDSSQMSANKLYRVEQIQPDELELVGRPTNTGLGPGEDYLLPVAHFSKEVYATFGTPFHVRVRNGEPFKDVRARIQKRLDVNEKDFASVSIYFIKFSKTDMFVLVKISKISSNSSLRLS
jgi:ubiquitin carboxyl-terminal hydrolase 7